MRLAGDPKNNIKGSQLNCRVCFKNIDCVLVKIMVEEKETNAFRLQEKQKMQISREPDQKSYQGACHETVEAGQETGEGKWL